MTHSRSLVVASQTAVFQGLQNMASLSNVRELFELYNPPMFDLQLPLVLYLANDEDDYLQKYQWRGFQCLEKGQRPDKCPYPVQFKRLVDLEGLRLWCKRNATFVRAAAERGSIRIICSLPYVREDRAGVWGNMLCLLQQWRQSDDIYFAIPLRVTYCWSNDIAKVVNVDAINDPENGFHIPAADFDMFEFVIWKPTCVSISAVAERRKKILENPRTPQQPKKPPKQTAAEVTANKKDSNCSIE